MDTLTVLFVSTSSVCFVKSGVLRIKLGIHEPSLKHGIYLSQHYLDQHEVTFYRHSTGQLCDNAMTGAISVDSCRTTHQRKQHVAAFMRAQQQLGQHAVTCPQKTNKCDSIHDRTPAMLRC